MQEHDEEHDVWVAPARERGLKFDRKLSLITHNCRSRKGAWIEIRMSMLYLTKAGCRSRKGAWIEIKIAGKKKSAYKSRSRKGAWIEI